MTIEVIHELTGVFPPDVLPSRSGVYWTQTLDPETNEPAGEWGFSYFDATDRVWGCAYDDVDSAARGPDYEFASQTKQWLGLTEEVKP